MELRQAFRVFAGAATMAVLFTGPFEREAHANSSTTIVNEGSGMCLEVAPPINEPTNFAINGLSVLQAVCNGSTEQLWDIDFWHTSNVRGATFFTYHITNRRSGMCMDLTDGNLNNETRIQQWTCGSSTTMDWILSNANPYGTIYNDRALEAQVKFKCLDIRGGSTSSGALVQSYDCTTTPTNSAQRFTYINP